jgi:hypothetical protein
MECLVVIAVLIAGVWGAAIFLRGGLLTGALLVLLAGTCFGYPAWHTESAPLTSDRILWVLLMLQFAICWRLGLTESHRVTRTEMILLAFVVVLAASVAMHDWSYNHSQPASQLVFYYLMPLGMYCVGWQTKITERGLRAMFAALTVFGVYLGLTAIAEKWELTALVFPSHISSKDFTEFLGRSRGPLLNPAANGLMLGLCLGAGLMAWPRVSRLGKLLLIGFSALLCMGIFCTLTRSAWMGGSLGLLLLVFLTLPRTYRPWLVAATLLGAALLVATQWEDIVEFKRDKNLSARETASSAALRPTLAAIAWQMFCDRPLVGCGLGHYSEEHVNYLSDRDSEVVLEQGRGYVQHNVWLSLLTETGLIGMTLFLLLIIAWLRSAWRLWQAADSPLWMRQQGLLFLVLAVNYLINGMFQDMTIIPMMHTILFFMAGVTVNLQLRSIGGGEMATAAVAGSRG